MERDVDESIGGQEESVSAKESSKVVGMNDLAGDSSVGFVLRLAVGLVMSFLYMKKGSCNVVYYLTISNIYYRLKIWNFVNGLSSLKMVKGLE